jgi:hypothetical protein
MCARAVFVEKTAAFAIPVFDLLQFMPVSATFFNDRRRVSIRPARDNQHVVHNVRRVKKEFFESQSAMNSGGNATTLRPR